MSYISAYYFFIDSNTIDKIASLPKVITPKPVLPKVLKALVEPLQLNVRGQLVRLALRLHIQVDYSKHKYIDKLLYLYCSSRS